MSSLSPTYLAPAYRQSGERFRSHKGGLLALSILQLTAGVFAIGYAFSSTMIPVAALGVVFIVVAGAQGAAIVDAPTWRSMSLFLALGAIYCVAGAYTLAFPVPAAKTLTLMLVVVFFVVGDFRIAISLVERFPAWGCVCANGIETMLCGIAVLSEWSAARVWVSGALVGIDLIAGGAGLKAFAIGARTAFSPVSTEK